MIKEFKVEETDEQVRVHVELKERHDRLGIPKTRFSTSDVLEELKQRGHVLGPCTQESVIKNWHPKLLEGTWVFEKKKLDKPAKPVTLKEEKSVQPKSTRKRRTSSSTTKVSTED